MSQVIIPDDLCAVALFPAEFILNHSGTWYVAYVQYTEVWNKVLLDLTDLSSINLLKKKTKMIELMYIL